MVKLFICHASEDKNDIARPLANALREEGYEVWFDEFDLNLGDCLLQGINKGIQDSDYGVVIFSHSFFNKIWPKTELEGLIAKETSEKVIILPIWHKITVEDMKQNFPILANRVAETTDHGLRTIIEKIKKVVGNPSIRNMEGIEAPFSISDPMKKGAWIFATVNKSKVERGSPVIFRGTTNANPDFLYLNIFRLDDDDFPMKVFTIKTDEKQSFEFPVNTYPLKKGQYRVMIELPTGEYTKLSFLVEDKATSNLKISPAIVPSTQTHMVDQAIMEKIKEITDWIPPTSQVISEAAISGDYLKMGLNAALLKVFLDKNLIEIQQLALGAITRKAIAHEFIAMLENLRAAADLTTKAVDKYNAGDVDGATQLMNKGREFSDKAMYHLNQTNLLYNKSQQQT